MAGTPRECRDRLEEYLSVGLDEPIIEISGTGESRALNTMIRSLVVLGRVNEALASLRQAASLAGHISETMVHQVDAMAVSVAALTVYDLCKSVDRGITIERIRLEEKSGGRSGTFRQSD